MAVRSRGPHTFNVPTQNRRMGWTDNATGCGECLAHAPIRKVARDIAG
jgi:hypothetical protein